MCDSQFTFSELVANLVPCRFMAIQLNGASWAGISVADFSVLARSTIWTWPDFLPGKVKSELLLFGHNTHSPERFQLITNVKKPKWNLLKKIFNVYMVCHLNFWTVFKINRNIFKCGLLSNLKLSARGKRLVFKSCLFLKLQLANFKQYFMYTLSMACMMFVVYLLNTLHVLANILGVQSCLKS